MTDFNKPIRRLPLLTTLGALMLTAAAYSQTAATNDAEERAWRHFQHALGQPARIGDNADHSLASDVFRPIPSQDPATVDLARFDLGFRLFHEGRLSSANSIACVTCHAGALSGADRRRVSIGVGGEPGTMNALSVFNATFNFRQFWDGRAVTLEDQALQPIENPVEMAHSLEAVLSMLQQDTQYPDLFNAAYPDGITVENMADAIAHFQRINFIRHNTPFQHYLNGDAEALDAQQQRGMQRFKDLGCASCHNGINLGGNSYQKLGTALPFYNTVRIASEDDDGIMTRSEREHDRHVFRVPGLHGVSSTAPYFHDGRISTLQEAVELMARHQLGRELSQQDNEDISAFLRALSGPISFDRPVSTGSGRATTDASAHIPAYLATMDAIAPTYSRLLQAARQIHNDTVAHFDFLQFEHRELLRQAGSLHHPPTTLPPELQESLRTEAKKLLALVDDLEWPIADFLRAEAMSRVYLASQQQSSGELHLSAAEIEIALQDQRRRAARALAEISNSDLPMAAERMQHLYAQQNHSEP